MNKRNIIQKVRRLHPVLSLFNLIAIILLIIFVAAIYQEKKTDLNDLKQVHEQMLLNQDTMKNTKEKIDETIDTIILKIKNQQRGRQNRASKKSR